MPNINYQIEVLEGLDNRSNEIPLKLLIQNESDERVKLLTIVPNIPQSVQLEEKQDVFQEEALKQYQDLCSEMTLLADKVLISTNTNHRENFIKTYSDTFKQVFNDLPTIYKLMLMDRQMFRARMRFLSKQIEKLTFKISNLEDANWAYTNIVEPLDKGSSEKILYEGKLKQLRDLALKQGNLGDEYIAYIEPKSFYSRTYVLKFTRDSLSIKLYNISFDSKYRPTNLDSESRANVSTTIQVSPNPIALNLFTVVACILGATLKYSIQPTNTQNYYQFFVSLGNTIITSQGVTAIIVGILFFNIFEFTDIGKNFKSGVTWRTALVIGILSGMFSDRLIEAIKVFAGIK